MRRREFAAGLGSLLLLPFGAKAQPLALPIVGLLSGTDREPRIVGAILKGIAELGLGDGRDLTVEFRGAGGRSDRLPDLAMELIRHPVSVIVGTQSANAPLAAKAASHSVPVVFCIGGDPVALGLVASLNRPGRHVTGTTFLVNTLGAKRLELVRELVPSGGTVGLLINPRNPASPSETADVQAASGALGLRIFVANAGSPPEIDAAFESFAREGTKAVTFAADAVFNARRAQIIALAARHRLPTMYFYREFAEAGGLMSYGGDDTDAYRLAGTYAGRILKGEKPQELPVQQSTKVELVINLKIAEELGVAIPPALLSRADGVID